MKARGLWKWLSLLIPLLVLGLMVWLVARQWDQVVSFPWRIHLPSLLLVFIFHSLALAATFWVWHLMVSRLGGFKDVGLNFRYYYLSTLAKRIPSSIPYIGSRLVMYRQIGVSGAIIMNCIVLENVLIGVAGLITFFLFLPFYSAAPSNVLLPLSLLGIGMVLALWIRPQIFIDITNWLLRRLGRNSLEMIPNRREIFTWIGLYILPWLFAGASLYFAPRALSELNSLPLIDSLEISTLATLVSLLNLILPGGLSLKELTASTLLTAWMPFSAALVISLSYRLIHTLNEVLWALLALAWPIRPNKRPVSGEPSEDFGLISPSKPNTTQKDY